MISFDYEGENMERWEIINAVQRMQDYIADNINMPITLSDIAKAAGYSQWHSARMFKEFTKSAVKSLALAMGI